MLGQVKAADKSNEIIAIPALLAKLAIEGAIVTIDALGCQRAIVSKIKDKKADYVLAPKPLRDMRTYPEAFARFETVRKPRVEKIVAEGRRRGRDKTIVGPLEQKIGELMMRVFLRLFGKNGDNWLWEYKIDWE